MAKCEACKGVGMVEIAGKSEVCVQCKGTGYEKPITAAPHGTGIAGGVTDRSSMYTVSSGCFRRTPRMYSDS